MVAFILVCVVPLDDCSSAQLAAWLEAATAGLRLLPRLAALDAQLKQHSSELAEAEMCCTSIWSQLLSQLPQQLDKVGQQQRREASHAAARGSLTAPLWALHTSLCRLVAALTAPAAQVARRGA